MTTTVRRPQKYDRLASDTRLNRVKYPWGARWEDGVLVALTFDEWWEKEQSARGDMVLI